MECYEILYTPYRIINPIYQQTFNSFVQEFSNIMSYERVKYSLTRKLIEHFSHILWIKLNSGDNIYNKKRLYWALRVQWQLTTIIAGQSFKESLIYRGPYNLRNIKEKINFLSNREFNTIYSNI
jgi:hypothetical protein